MTSNRLDHRQWVLVFIAGWTLCLVFFILGFYVGRWSGDRPLGLASARAQESLLPTDGQQAAPGTSPASAPRDPDRTPAGPSGPDGAADRPVKDSPDSAERVDPSQPATAQSAGPETEDASSPPAASKNEQLNANRLYYIRVGVFKSSNEASGLTKQLRGRGFITTHAEPVTSEDETLYLVLLGPWVNRETALIERDALSNLNLPESTIITK